MKEQDCHREHGELTESTEECIGIWNQSEFRLNDLIQALCELTDPNSISTRKRGVTEGTEESRRAQSEPPNSEPIRLPTP